MIGSDRWLESRKDEGLLILCGRWSSDFEDRAGTITDIEVARLIEGNASRNAEALRVNLRNSCIANTIDNALCPGTDVEQAVWSER